MFNGYWRNKPVFVAPHTIRDCGLTRQRDCATDGHLPVPPNTILLMPDTDPLAGNNKVLQNQRTTVYDYALGGHMGMLQTNKKTSLEISERAFAHSKYSQVLQNTMAKSMFATSLPEHEYVLGGYHNMQ